jgi:hypothetical protein
MPTPAEVSALRLVRTVYDTERREVLEGHLRIGACLSLSGRFAQFGRQAAAGLRAWKAIDGTVEVAVDDDRSDRSTLQALLPDMAARCDILLGPYSTVLMRAAGRMAAEAGWLIWNHGGSGDDVERMNPGHVVSVLTPTSRYAESFLRHLAAESGGAHDLCIVQGAGSFGRQVTDGAAAMTLELGIRTVRVVPEEFPPHGLSPNWSLLSAGVFERDVETVSKALKLSSRPRQVCTVAAGVREFANVVDDPEGVFGIAQWFPGSGHEVLLGPDETEFMHVFASITGSRPDYPAVQAAAGAILATHCARLAGGTQPGDLWEAASSLDTSTMFGGFQIDATGMQVKHEIVLIRWRDHQPMAVPSASQA